MTARGYSSGLMQVKQAIDKRHRPATDEEYQEVIEAVKSALALLYTRRPSRLTASEISEKLLNEICLLEDGCSHKLEREIRKHLLMPRKRKKKEDQPQLASYQLGPGDKGITEIKCGKAIIEVDITHITGGEVYVKARQKGRG